MTLSATYRSSSSRSIGVADMGDRFVVSFLEAPMPFANDTMESWVKGLRR